MLGPRVRGPRCPGTSGDIPGCPRPGGSVRSQSPRSKMSWDIRGHPGMSQTWRQRQVPESQVQDVLGYQGTSRDVPDLEATSGPRVPGPRCPGISRDILGYPRRGGMPLHFASAIYRDRYAFLDLEFVIMCNRKSIEA